LPAETRIRRLPDENGDVIFDIDKQAAEHYVPLVTLEVAVDGKTLPYSLFYWTDKGRIVDGR
jgi:hypothetical protein